MSIFKKKIDLCIITQMLWILLCTYGLDQNNDMAYESQGGCLDKHIEIALEKHCNKIYGHILYPYIVIFSHEK